MLLELRCFLTSSLVPCVEGPRHQIAPILPLLSRTVVYFALSFLLLGWLLVVRVVEGLSLLIHLKLGGGLLEVKDILFRLIAIEIQPILHHLSFYDFVIPIITMYTIPVISHSLHSLQLIRNHTIARNLVSK